ncbi:MAG: flagellar export chaperone FliS [Candidatus Muiribacteriaceae bacterium]
MKKRFDQYRETQIKTASPGRLLLMLYDGAIRFLNQSINALESEPKDLEKAHNNIIKVQNIIMELTVTLDRKKGGDIAENLSDLYTFMKNHLVEANCRKEADYCYEIRDLMTELRDAWREVVAKEEGSDTPAEIPGKLNLKG